MGERERESFSSGVIRPLPPHDIPHWIRDKFFLSLSRSLSIPLFVSLFPSRPNPLPASFSLTAELERTAAASAHTAAQLVRRVQLGNFVRYLAHCSIYTM